MIVYVVYCCLSMDMLGINEIKQQVRVWEEMEPLEILKGEGREGGKEEGKT